MNYLFSTVNLYISRIFLLWVLITTGTVCAVIALFEGAEYARRAMGKPHIKPGIIIEMVFLKLPEHIQTLLPFIVLSGAMIAFYRLNKQNEIICLRSFGMSVWQLSLGLIATTMLIGIFHLLALNPIGAAMTTRLQSMESLIFSGQENQFSISETGLWIRENNNNRQSIIHANYMDKEGGFHDITFHNFAADDFYQERVDAPIAQLEKGKWQLSSARVSTPDGGELYHSQLSLPTKLTMDKIKDSNTDPATLSLWRLADFMVILDQSGLSTLSYRLYFHSMFSRLGMMIAMVFLAAAFALRSIRQGKVAIYIAFGLLGGFVMHFLSDIVYAMGLADQIPVVLAAWAPSLILMMVSIAILLQVEEG